MENQFTKAEIEIIHLGLVRLRDRLMKDLVEGKEEISKVKMYGMLELIPALTEAYQDSNTYLYKVFDLIYKIEDEYGLEEN